MGSLVNVLDQMTIQGELYENLSDNMLRCLACAHRCKISPGKRGICQVRFNDGWRTARALGLCGRPAS